MADTEQKKLAKISKLVYPFQKSAEAGKAGAKPTDIDDPQVYFDALSNAQDGFYPIGANGQWHGGIHFDTQTGNTLAQQDGIRCIGDGEVVAYQIDAKYPSIEYGAGKATYSRGFVLVRHRLELPPAPKQTAQPAPAGPGAANTAPSTPQPAAQPAATPDQKAKEPSLIFYSVYLHLLDWAGYQADPKKPRPAFWKSVAYVVGDKAKDRDRASNPSIPEAGIGLNLRDAQHQKVGYAPRGAKLRLGAENPNKKGYFVISEVVSGQTVPADAKGLYAYKAELTAAGAEPDRQDAVYVLPTPAPIKAGELIGHLGHYQRFADLKPLAATGPAQNGVRPLVQLDVFTAEDLKTFIAKSRERAKLLDAKQKTLLKIDVGAKLVLPSEPDQQIGAGEAAAVVAGGKDGAWVQVRKGTLQIMDKGSLSGFNSTTHAYGGGQILHRVLGASDSDSITEAAYNALKTKEEKDKYPRRQVLVPSGAPVWVQKALMGADASVAGRSLKAWSTFPLQASQANGPEAGFIRVAAIKTLKKVATEPDGTRWWEVDVGKIDGSSGVGWAREKDHAKVTLCSPWDWPGFEFIEADGTTPEALYARHVVATKQAKPDEQAALEAKAAQANGGPLFSRVCDAIDLDDDRHLTPAELRKALKQPWLAEAISRLVFHHTSEWGTPRAQWNAIDGDIPESRKADWEKEKDRIESLQWWSDVKTTPALPGDAKVYAFHPIGLISNFNRENNQLITLEMLRAANPTGDESYHELIIPMLNEYAPVYGINTPLRIAHFLAQTGHESGFKIREENGNYSALRMRQIFGCKGGQKNYVTATDSCKIGKLRDKLWTDESAYANNAKNLLSYVYANRMGNGDEASQDGYTYRGRGLIQLTGKAMYRNYMNYHNNALPADQKDFISSPDLISSELRYGVESAFWYCNANNFSAAADADDLTKTTIIVNGGENGMPDRRKRLDSLKSIMGIN
ncbi:glycoside hydrolase family 19 protein [Xanthomonas oryzae]|uniref:glycoside hydrolase family 19 protein n=1 Tax=Xanthomonas oryzae TaxID=347 RepID=UPI001F4CA39E|nr:calcium-binding protein [Xanthomonas oryzae]UNE63763.1 calcium-binding protein [Xanthomonas oryzae]